MKLLLAEDEMRMASALTELLKMENYDVDHVSDGSSALAALESDIYDAAIIDVMMPGMNGFDVVYAARNRGIKTPVLMLTAKSVSMVIDLLQTVPACHATLHRGTVLKSSA